MRQTGQALSGILFAARRDANFGSGDAPILAVRKGLRPTNGRLAGGPAADQSADQGVRPTLLTQPPFRRLPRPANLRFPSQETLQAGIVFRSWELCGVLPQEG